MNLNIKLSEEQMMERQQNIARLKENEWFRLNKIVPFKKIYRQVRDLLEGKEDARMVFIVDVIKKNDDFSAVRLNPTNENDLKNKNVKSSKFSGKCKSVLYGGTTFH